MTETPAEDPVPANSILGSMKSALGLAQDYGPFDAEIIMHINSIFGDLHQLGVGPEIGYEIEDVSNTWTEFFGDDKRLSNIKSYTYLRLRLLHDPPAQQQVVTAFEKQIEKAEFRIQIAQDEIKNPPPPEPSVIPDDPFGEIEIVVDGGLV
jgi:hypothetical protein